MRPKILHYRIKKSSNKKFFCDPVVFIRGLGRSMGFWLDFEDEISKYCDVIFIDLLGTGGSKSIFGRGSVFDFASDVILTLENISIKNFHLCGISMGGMVVIEIAKMSLNGSLNALKLNSICVMASSSGGINQKRIYRSPLFLLLFALLASLGLNPPRHKIISSYLVSKETLERQKNIINEWDDLWKKEGFSHIAVLRQLYAAAIYKADLDKTKINVPTIFIVSKQDALVPWTNTIALWQCVPFSELCVFENLGHDLTTDNPLLLANTMSQFFKKSENLI